MASQVKWSAPSALANVLTTELNSLANNGVTAVGSELDNAATKNQYGYLQLAVTFASAPTAGGYINVYRVLSLDGSTYPTPTGQLEPTEWVCSIQVDDGTSAQKLNSRLIVVPPFKQKFILENKTGQAFPASGSTLSITMFNDEGQ